MQYTEIMVRYGELSTKGKNRKNFIDRLGFNVRESLHSFENLVIKAHRDRMHIQLHGEDYEAVMKRLKQVFGIQNFSPSIKVERDIEKVKATAVEMVKEKFKEGMTFKINTRRSDHNYQYDTNEMNDILGSHILREVPGIKVKMKNPDMTLRCEVRADGIYLSHEKIDGAGGLPVGTAGKAMLMLSGGIDSPVAGYLAMKRGVDIEMVHFFSPPYTSEQALNKAKDLTGVNSSVCPLAVSLAATKAIAFAFSSCSYLDVSVHCVFLYITLTVMSDRHYLPGSPIRTSLDHCSLTAPQSISSLVTSFIGF